MTKVKVILKIILTASLAFVFQSFLPWWSGAAAALLIAFILYTRPGSSFLAGFLGIGLLWIIVSIFTVSTAGTLLTDRVAAIFSLPGSISLAVVTGIIGGLAGGVAAIAGSYLRDLVLPPVEF